MTSNALKNQVMIDLGPEGTWLTLYLKTQVKRIRID